MITSELASDPEKKKEKKSLPPTSCAAAAAADLIDYIWSDKATKRKAKEIWTSSASSANNNCAC